MAIDILAYAKGAEAAQQQNWRDALNEMRMQRDAESLAQSQAAWQLNFPLAQQQATLAADALTQQGTDLAAMRRAAETQTQLLGELSGLAPAEQATRIAERIGGRLQQLAQTPGDRGAPSEIRAYQDYVSRLAAGYDQARDFDSAARLRAIFAGAQGQSPLQQQITAGSEALAAYQRGERMWQDPRTGQITLLPENPAIAQQRQQAESKQWLAQLRQLRPDLADRYALIGNQLVMLPPVPPIPMPVSGMTPPIVSSQAPATLPSSQVPAPTPSVAESYPAGALPTSVASPMTQPPGTAPSVATALEYPVAGSFRSMTPEAIRTFDQAAIESAFRRFGMGAVSALLGPQPIRSDPGYVNYIRQQLELTRRLQEARQNIYDRARGK